MATTQANVAPIFEDARRNSDAALERLAAGEFRDAAGKAWCAALRATKALVLARTSQEPETHNDVSLSLQKLTVADPSLRDLLDCYCDLKAVLHDECFLHDYMNPKEIDMLVRETADYVRDAERFAQA